MAHRRTHRRRHPRRIFSKKERAAIERIAEGEIETNHWDTVSTFAAYMVGYVSPASAHMVRYNFLAPIPRITNSTQPPTGQEGFRGNLIELRGVKLNINLFQTGAVAGDLWDVLFRVTFYEMNDFLSGSSQVLTSGAEVPQYGDNTIAWFNWNTQSVKIHRQFNFRMDNNGNRNALVRKKFWVPWVRKCEPEGTDTFASGLEYFGSRKGTNLYFAIEVSAPGATTSLTAMLQGNIETKVYFKDA